MHVTLEVDCIFWTWNIARLAWKKSFSPIILAKPTTAFQKALVPGHYTNIFLITPPKGNYTTLKYIKPGALVSLFFLIWASRSGSLLYDNRFLQCRRFFIEDRAHGIQIQKYQKG